MTWALQFDGVNDYLTVSLSNPISANQPFEIEVRATVPSNYSRPFGSSAGNSSRLLIFNSTNEVRLTDSFGVSVSFVAPSYTKTDFNTFKFIRDSSNNVSFYLNDVFVSTKALSGAFAVNQIGRQSTSGYTKGDIEFIRFNEGGTDTNYWDATASSHAAGTPILIDTIGGNNATAVNMPTDGSAWVDLGGGGATPVDIDFNSSKFNLTSSSVSLAKVSDIAFSASESNSQSSLMVLGGIAGLVFSNATFSTGSEQISVSRTTGIAIEDSTLGLTAQSISIDRTALLSLDSAKLGVISSETGVSRTTSISLDNSSLGVVSEPLLVSSNLILAYQSSTLGVKSQSIGVAAITQLDFSSTSMSLEADVLTGIDRFTNANYRNGALNLNSGIMIITGQPTFDVDVADIRLINTTEHYNLTNITTHYRIK